VLAQLGLLDGEHLGAGGEELVLRVTEPLPQLGLGVSPGPPGTVPARGSIGSAWSSPVIRSNRAAACSTAASPRGRPTICRPTGRPKRSKPQGTARAGQLVMVIAEVISDAAM